MTTPQSKALKVLPNDLIDELLAGYQKPEDLIGENGLLKQLTKALVERALQAEMAEHLGHDKHSTIINTARIHKRSATLYDVTGGVAMGQQYKQLCMEERCEIAWRQRSGETCRQIAASMDRSPSSITRELARNDSAKGYVPTYAQQQTQARRWTGSKLLRDPILQAEVLQRLAAGASPQAVSGRLKRERG